MRTNHVNPDPLKTMPPGTGWGMDFQVVMDAPRPGEPSSTGSVQLVRHRGHLVLDRSGRGLRVRRHAAAPETATARSVHSLSHQLAYQAIKLTRTIYDLRIDDFEDREFVPIGRRS